MPPILPDAYLSRMESLLAKEYPAFAKGYDRLPVQGLRLNTLKVSNLPTAWANWKLKQLSWCPSGALIQLDSNPGKHPYHAAGLYYLQEPSAMAVAETMSPQPGERILDLCAAPGGKTTHLAALMGDQGLLVANEIHRQRVWELAENLERCGVTNATILNETPARLATHFGAYFDRVLVDAPCSGEGMFRKSAAARQDWSPELVQSCAIRQSAILDEAVKMVRPGGWLAYSTCTFNPQENEGVIARLLGEHPELEIVEIPQQEGFSAGRPEWVPSGPGSLARCVRLWPHLAPGEGHFVALLQKSKKVSQFSADDVGAKLRKMEPINRKNFDDFCRAELNISFAPERLTQVGSYLYRLPENLPDLGGLKVIHPGWWLGSLKKERFEPSHALALGIHAREARQTLDFAAHSTEIASYLHGETLASPGENGWVLVCVDGYPLGWGKRSQGIVKNNYPHGLRR
jgi:NOL1/NOP2/sun family putative RNA methylase